MAEPRPTDLDYRFLGSQGGMSELKMELDSHKDPEFKVSWQNHVEVKLKTGMSVKVSASLTHCATGKDRSEYVFFQKKMTGELFFHVNFPTSGWYKFMIFALEASNPAKLIPNVFNYLIEVERIFKPANPAVTAYSKFQDDCCYLHEPRTLRASSLQSVLFVLTVPGAKAVAVHAVRELLELTNKGGDEWEGKFDLSKHCGKGDEVTVNASYDDSNMYTGLLKYSV